MKPGGDSRGIRGRGPMDRTVLLVVLLLAGVGTVMVYSASSSMATAAWGDSGWYLKRHLGRLIIGLGLMLLLAQVRYEQVARRLGGPLLAISIVALLLVLIPGLGGLAAKGAHRWLAVGPFTFQPSDLARLALILWLAHTLAGRCERLESFREGVLPLLGPMAAVVVLVMLEPDVSTGLVIAALGMGMLFLGGVRLRHLAALGAAALPVAALIVMSRPHSRSRITAFLDSGSDPLGANYQVTQSLIGLGSGGLLGQGLGNSGQKLRFLPEPYNDFIFSIVGEEWGFVGAGVILVLFALLVLRGLRIAARAPDRTGALLAAGISLSIALYVILNVGVVTSTLPATGLALPFISYGGSSLLFSLASIGLLLSISRHTGLGGQS